MHMRGRFSILFLALTSAVLGQGVTGTNGTDPFPTRWNKGSLVGALVNTTNANATYAPGTNSTAIGCGTSGSLWLKDGTFRNPIVITSSNNGLSAVLMGVNANCMALTPTGATAFVPSLNGGGILVPPNAVAGVYSASTAYGSFWHQNAFFPFGFGTTKSGMNVQTGGNVLDIVAEFVDDAGLYHTIIPNGSLTALTASSTQFLGFYGQNVSSTELNTALPIPVAGTIDGALLCNNAGSTANVTVTLRKNSANAGSNTFTVPSNVGCGYDTTDTVAVVAGDYVTLQTASGVTTQAQPISSQISFFPSSGTSTIVGGYLGAATVSTTKTFNAPLTSKNGTTEATEQTAFPISETCTNLYVVKATANSGVTTTYTIRDNGVDTAITGTESSGTGAIAIYTGAGVTIAAGHLVSLSYVTASGTSGTMAGWSMSCQ